MCAVDVRHDRMQCQAKLVHGYVQLHLFVLVWNVAHQSPEARFDGHRLRVSAKEPGQYMPMDERSQLREKQVQMQQRRVIWICDMIVDEPVDVCGKLRLGWCLLCDVAPEQLGKIG